MAGCSGPPFIIVQHCEITGLQTVISRSKYTYKLIDYVKLWFRNRAIIKRILADSRIKWNGTFDVHTGEISAYPLIGAWGVWEFEIKSATWLQITGSLHKYWNNGTNWNDFYFTDLLTSIIDLCNTLEIAPYDMSLHNLEFGVNIRPLMNASQIIGNIICYKNRESIKKIREGMYFIEFAMGEYYLKIYDKGLQAQTEWGMNIGNVLRVEIKAMNSGYFADAGIKTLADLLNPNNLQVLGKKINKVFKDVVFDDWTVNPDVMTAPDRKIYMRYNNPREWAKNRKIRTSTIVAQENRFRAIVGKYGALNLHRTLSELVADKVIELLTVTDDTLQSVDDFLQHCKLCGFSYLKYTPKINKVPQARKCKSCGGDISNQKKGSKFCSPKFVGVERAHKCRNDDSNPRNNHNRQVGKIYAQGPVLFDIIPYLQKVS